MATPAAPDADSPVDETGPAAASSREYAAALAGLVLGAALMLLALAQDWIRATATAPGSPAISIVLSGRALVPIAAGAAIVLLAGAAGVVAARNRWRVTIGIVLVVVASGAVIAVAMFAVAGPPAARLVAELGVPATAVTTSIWWLVCLFGAVLADLAGLAVVVRGRSWPVMTSRYERKATRTQNNPTGNSAARIWDALDRGEDPTR